MSDGFLKKPEGWNENISNKKNTNESCDIIIVLMGGMTDTGACPPWVIQRLLKAYEQHRITGAPILCTGGGTYHKPNFSNENGFHVYESTAASEYLLTLGVQPQNILLEWASYDTIANAYFSFMNHIIPNNWLYITVITSEFHMTRCEAIFNHILQLCQEQFTYTGSIKYTNSPDYGIAPDVLQTRKEREKKSEENFKIQMKEIKTLTKFHKWLFTVHKAYSCNDKKDRGAISNSLKKTY